MNNDELILELNVPTPLDLEIDSQSIVFVEKAENISYDNEESGLGAENVQDALDEIQAEVILKADADDVETALDLKADKATTYTKDETDTLLSAKANSADVYTKGETDTLLSAKANSADVYTKSETDNLLSNKANVGDSYTKAEDDSLLALKADKADTYTKSEVDTALAAKANVGDSYTKAEEDLLLADKADKADTYTKAETDSLLDTKENVLTWDNYPVEESANPVKSGGLWALLLDIIQRIPLVFKKAFSAGNPVQIDDGVASAMDELAVSVTPKQATTPWINSTKDTDPYTFRSMPSGASGGNREYDKLVGGSVVWNQLVQNGDFADSTGWSVQNAGSNLTISDGVATWTTTQTNSYGERIQRSFVSTVGHKYLFACEAKVVPVNNVASVDFVPALFRDSAYVGNGSQTIPTNAWTSVMCYVTAITNPSNRVAFGLGRQSTTDVGIGSTVSVRRCMLIDLTAMFGTTVANSMTAELFRKYFPKSYYAYTATPKIESVSVSEKVTTGVNLFGHISTAITVSGVTYAWGADGTLTANGTSSGETGATNSAWKNNGYVTLPSGSYKIVRNVPTVNSGKSQNGWYLYDYDNGTRVADITNTVQTFSLSAPTNVYLACYQYNAGYTNASVQIMLCSADVTDTAYVAYSPNTYSLSHTELRGIPSIVDGQLSYDGDEYASSGTVTRKYAVVDLGSLSWTYSSSGQGTMQSSGIGANAKKPATFNDVAKLVCAKYVTYSGNAVYGGTNGIALSTNGDIWVHDASYTDPAIFKTAMSGVQMVFELNDTYPYGQAILADLTWGTASNNRFVAPLPNALNDGTDITSFVIEGYKPQASFADGNAWINDSKLYIVDSTHSTVPSFVADLGAKVIIYPLQSGKTESTTPFTNPQVIDEHGTESYTDYPMSQGTRDVAIPVGHKSNYALSVPVVGTDEVAVQILGGVNLWDEEWEVGSIDNDTGMNTTGTTNVWRCKNYIPVIGGRQYYFLYGGVTSARWYAYDKDKNFLSTTTYLSGVKNIPENVAFIRFRSTTQDGNNKTYNVGLNYPATDTSYHEYKGNEVYRHEFSTTMYGGTVEMVSGVETTEMAEVDLGTFTWSTPSTATGWTYTGNVINSIGSGNNNVLLDNFRSNAFTRNSWNGIENGQIALDSVGKRVAVKADLFIGMTSSDVQAVLSGTKLIYTLATPTTNQGAGSAVATLDGTNIFSTDGDSVSGIYTQSAEGYLNDFGGDTP